MQVRILPTFLVTVIVSTSSLLASKSAFAAPSNNQYQASKYRELGLSYQRQKRYPEAIASMKKSVELEPNNFNGRVNLGWTQHLAGQEDNGSRVFIASCFS
jgi:tetratricopeptide (TPR) repeat protein